MVAALKVFQINPDEMALGATIDRSLAYSR
mgnify:CR=1 FL=1